MQADEAVVYDFCVELARRRAVGDNTFARAKAMLTEQQIVDLLVLNGFYAMIAMLLNASEAAIPNAGPPLASMADPLPLE
jgi:4-carboxymuconolactone decarboxylase